MFYKILFLNLIFMKNFKLFFLNSLRMYIKRIANYLKALILKEVLDFIYENFGKLFIFSNKKNSHILNKQNKLRNFIKVKGDLREAKN